MKVKITAQDKHGNNVLYLYVIINTVKEAIDFTFKGLSNREQDKIRKMQVEVIYTH